MLSLNHQLSPMVIKKELIAQASLNKEIDKLIDQITKLKCSVLNSHISLSQNELIRPEIVHSWLRSKDYGIDVVNTRYERPVVDKAIFEQLLREKQYLIDVAAPYMHQLANILSDVKNRAIILTDEQGVFLHLVCDSKTTQTDYNLNIGDIWNEETVGTTAHGMSLILEAPFQIWGPEHYNQIWSQTAGSAAPIFDINSNLAGSLAITHDKFLYCENPHTLALVMSTAIAIQNQFQLISKNDLLNSILNVTDESIIIINKKAIITQASLGAKKLFYFLNKELVGMHIKNLLGNLPLLKTVLKTGKTLLDIHIEIECRDQQLYLHSVKPIINNFGRTNGFILTLMKNEKPRKQASYTDARLTFDKIIGDSPQFIRSITMAKKYARLDSNILILGESGTGKELYAQAIHNESRPNGPFIAINCAALPKTLIEAELFGYEGGSFTGAERHGRQGKIELANNGTLFLDEIGDMPLEIQPVLLRVLEEKKVIRVGGNRYIPVGFRLVAATNKNLLDLVKNGQFRNDLYYRLLVFKIDIPPLRDRGPDIITLAKYFIKTESKKQQLPTPFLSEEAKYSLLQYNWPGNVRQLENAMVYAVNVSDNEIIKPEDLPDEVVELITSSYSEEVGISDATINNSYSDNHISKGIKKLENYETTAIKQALQRTGGKIGDAAKLLGISKSTLYRRVKKIHLL